MKAEQAIKIQLIEQEANNLNYQLQMIEENIKEVNELIGSLNEIEKGKNILINLGKKIYLPVEIKDDNLTVDVGKGNFVKKNTPDTIKIAEEQVERLINSRNLIVGKLNELQKDVDSLFLEIEKE